MKFFKSLFLLLLFLSSIFIPRSFALAEIPNRTVPLVNPIGGEVKKGGDTKGVTDVKLIIATALKVVLGILGSLTLLVFIYGGYEWLTSAGNSEKVQKGTSALLYATIGLFIIFGAYAILNTILKGIAR